ncbi:MAG TPA: ABC transporter permease [Chloroflexota bacterium]|nr:ABC transporter permease [Chloroflexota bacterium]
MNTLRIANLTFREAVRRKALYGAIGMTIVFLALYGWGIDAAMREMAGDTGTAGIQRQAAELGIDTTILAVGQLFVAGLFAVSNIASLLAIFMAAGTIAQEVDQGTLYAIVSKPVARWQVVVGKWLGGAAMLAVYVTVTSLAAAAIVYWRAGFLSDKLPQGILLLIAKAALLYSITMLGSAVMPAITAGIVMFILYSVTNVTGLLEQVGQGLQIESLVQVGIFGGLVLPADALWRMAAHTVQPPNPLLALGIRTMIGPFMVLHPPSIWMGVYAVGYMAAALGTAIWRFSRRDL